MSPGAIVGARSATASRCRVGSAGARTSPKRPRPARTPSQLLGPRPSPCRQKIAPVIAAPSRSPWPPPRPARVAQRHRGEARGRSAAQEGSRQDALWRATTGSSSDDLCERREHPRTSTCVEESSTFCMPRPPETPDLAQESQTLVGLDRPRSSCFGVLCDPAWDTNRCPIACLVLRADHAPVSGHVYEMQQAKGPQFYGALG